MSYLSDRDCDLAAFIYLQTYMIVDYFSLYLFHCHNLHKGLFINDVINFMSMIPDKIILLFVERESPDL